MILQSNCYIAILTKLLVVPTFVCHKPTTYYKSKNVTNKNFDLLGSKFQNSYDQACGPTKSEI